jgi:uncharacterized protein (TIGR02145 family)
LINYSKNLSGFKNPKGFEDKQMEITLNTQNSMKNVVAIQLIMLLVGISIIFSSCIKEKETIPLTLSTNPSSSKDVGAEVGSFNIAITSTTTWTAGTSADWLDASPTSGSNNGTVAINFEKNPNATSRSATITLVGTGVENIVITVNQAGLVLTKPTATTQDATNKTDKLATLNGVINANGLSTNVAFEYGLTTSYGQTITALQSPVSGNTNTNVSAGISGLSENTTYHFRVSGTNAAGTTNGNDLTFTTAVAPVLSVSPTSMTFESSGTITDPAITITSNLNWTASSNQSWCLLSATSGSNNGSLNVTCSANGNTIPRQATITFSGLGAVDKTVTVTQAGSAPYIAVAQPTAGTSWIMNTIQNIQWSDNVPDAVKIELYKGTSLISTLSASEAGNSYSWNIPMTLTAGTDFKIKITSTTNAGLYGESPSFTISLYTGMVQDIDGNKYNTIQIGQQIWMKENLRVTHNPSGGIINSLAYMNNNSNVPVYGRLYTYNLALQACPTGWHLPSDVECTQLINYLGGTSIAGGRLKETGNLHWTDPNSGATNESGFTAVGSGYQSGGYNGLNYDGSFWTSTANNSINAYYVFLYYNVTSAIITYDNKTISFSVRCVKTN